MAAFAGCSPGRNAESVRGTVTLDGKPLADIRVNFQPQASDRRESGVGSYGLTDANGSFVLHFVDDDTPGALVGLHNVTLSDKRAEDDADSGGSSKGPKSRLPPAYNNHPLTYRVRAGEKNEPRFELTSHH